MIVAGGAGTRMGGGIPKQFRNLCGRPVLWWSMKAFHDEAEDTKIILVLPKDFITLWDDFFVTLPVHERFEHQIACGGESRTESVKNGLSLIDDPEALVAIHDGARPLVTPDLISRGWSEAQKSGATVPVIPVTDSLRRKVGNISETVDRSEYVAVQTPQVFKVSVLKDAYSNMGEGVFSDDASVVEHAGERISLYPGSPHNIKITNPQDMALAKILLNEP